MSRRHHREGPRWGITARPAPRDPVAALQRVELFSGMDRRQAEQIGRLLKERRFKKGETVIMEGTGGAAFFVIGSGEATVSSKGVELATLGPGNYFGEVALIDGGPRSATVTAAADLVCYGLTFWDFRPLVESNRNYRMEAAASARETVALRCQRKRGNPLSRSVKRHC